MDEVRGAMPARQVRERVAPDHEDHVNVPNSICNHAVDWIDPLDREKTINAMVIDLTAREMHIAWGNPCQNNYHTYHLDA